MHAEEMIRTHPDANGKTNAALIRCIEACYDCAHACTSCADACLGEDMVEELRQCIRTCLDCADLCALTGILATRHTGSNGEVLRRVLGACEIACRTCAEECARHADHHEHCRVCGESCQRCERACQEALQSLG